MFEAVTGCYQSVGSSSGRHNYALYDADLDILYYRHDEEMGMVKLQGFWTSRDLVGRQNVGWRLHPGYEAVPHYTICANCETPLWETHYLCSDCRAS